MSRFVFVSWLLFYPVACQVGIYLSHLMGKSYTHDVIATAAVINFIIWIAIAILLWTDETHRFFMENEK